MENLGFGLTSGMRYDEHGVGDGEVTKKNRKRERDKIVISKFAAGCCLEIRTLLCDIFEELVDSLL
jgi:hypothetical protein